MYGCFACLYVCVPCTSKERFGSPRAGVTEGWESNLSLLQREQKLLTAKSAYHHKSFEMFTYCKRESWDHLGEVACQFWQRMRVANDASEQDITGTWGVVSAHLIVASFCDKVLLCSPRRPLYNSMWLSSLAERLTASKGKSILPVLVRVSALCIRGDCVVHTSLWWAVRKFHSRVTWNL